MLVLAGWSLGGTAAAGVTLCPDAVGGWRPVRTVCLAGSFVRPDPITGAVPVEAVLSPPARTPPFALVHAPPETDPGVLSVVEATVRAIAVGEAVPRAFT
ncbi:MAG: hypothetical protein M3070_03220 [Actinomycetota bacterium]|nr:hypothetical protein [Actinomycetota bacterium]